MNPVPNEQNVHSKEVEEFLAKGGVIQQIPAGQRSEIETRTSFYGKRNKKAEAESEKK